MPAELSGVLSLPEAVAPWIRPLGLALLHALWQGLVIGALAALALRTLGHASPQARYATACTALAACVLWPALTLWRLAASTATTATTASLDTTGLAREPLRIDAIATTGTLDSALPWLVALWACGAALMLLRTAVGLHWVAHLRRRAQRIAEGEWAQRMQALSRRFGLGDVPLAVFEGDGGPLVAGLWRPMVFVPASLLAKMPPELLEALLAHELAHIRRHDYLANLLQRAAEALLFFHPVVWWLSRRIRQERELVADDLAASVLGEPKRLALALAELDQTFSLPNLAQAAHGGQLMSRIRSLLHPRRPSTTGALPLGVLAVACIGCLAYAQSSRTPVVAPVAAATATTASAGTASADKRASRTPRIATDGTIALVDADRDGIRMSGHSDDVDAIRDAKRQVDGDFLWLRRDGKAMVVRDPATVARVRALWNDRGDAFAEIGVGNADHRRFLDARDFVDVSFDLLRIDVEPAGDDQVLGAADDGNAAGLVHNRHVPGDEKTVVAELGGGLVGHPPITLEHVRSADLEYPRLAAGDLVAVVVGDAGFDPRQRKPDGAGHPLPFVGVGGVHPRFGHAVALENSVPGSLLERGEGIGEQRCRAGDEQPHIAADFPVQPGLLQKPGVERRHAHEHRRSRQPAQHRVDVELG